MINKNAEASIIRACMFSELAVTKSIEKLTADYFRYITQRNMFEAISDLFNDNKSIDMLTIADRMTENGKEVDMLHLNDISDLVMLDTSIDSHIDIVKKNTLTINTKKITAEIGNKIARNEDIAEVINEEFEEFNDYIALVKKMEDIPFVLFSSATYGDGYDNVSQHGVFVEQKNNQDPKDYRAEKNIVEFIGQSD